MFLNLSNQKAQRWPPTKFGVGAGQFFNRQEGDFLVE
jgi:hypothetical protein